LPREEPATVHSSHWPKAEAGLERLSSERRDECAYLLTLAACVAVAVPAGLGKANGEGLFYDWWHSRGMRGFLLGAS